MKIIHYFRNCNVDLLVGDKTKETDSFETIGFDQEIIKLESMSPIQTLKLFLERTDSIDITTSRVACTGSTGDQREKNMSAGFWYY